MHTDMFSLNKMRKVGGFAKLIISFLTYHPVSENRLLCVMHALELT
jgi:hypothetical protein